MTKIHFRPATNHGASNFAECGRVVQHITSNPDEVTCAACKRSWAFTQTTFDKLSWKFGGRQHWSTSCGRCTIKPYLDSKTLLVLTVNGEMVDWAHSARELRISAQTKIDKRVIVLADV